MENDPHRRISRRQVAQSRTRERLAALGCCYAAGQLDAILGEAVRQETPAHAFLDLLLETELSGREARRVKTSLKMSNLPTGQTLGNFDFAFQPAIERSRVETLATCAWVRNAESVLLQGPPGVGKTHICVALGVRAVEQGFSVQYFRFDELMTALKVMPGCRRRGWSGASTCPPPCCSSTNSASSR